jgi:serine/threonine protein kinase
MIDFGLSKRYKCPKTGEHVKRKKGKGVIGTPRYCSLNAYRCYEQGRRDDLESIGNVLIYFAKKGELPWSKYEEKSTRFLTEFRKELSIEEMCKGLPDCFLEYMNYCRFDCGFEMEPDYQYLRDLF